MNNLFSLIGGLVVVVVLGVGVYTGLKTGWDLDEMWDLFKTWLK